MCLSQLHTLKMSRNNDQMHDPPHTHNSVMKRENEVKISVTIISFIGIQPHLFVYCLWLLSCYNDRVVTESMWPERPNMFTTWSFNWKGVQPLPQRNGYIHIWSRKHT